MKTAKLLALCLCLPLCLTACTQAEPSESSSESSSVSSSSESQSKEEPYKITLTDELVRANNANARNGGYIMEEERYIVYRNPADNGKLYRYEKETGEVKVIYNDNVTKIHSIKFFDNRIYFVTRTATDEVPTLYSIDIEGENLERIIENVGDDYVLTNDTIYYTTYRESNGAIFYLYSYDKKNGKSSLMRAGQTERLNLVGDDIYFVDYTFTGESETSGSGVICKINVKTNEVEAIPIVQQQIGEISHIGKLFCVDNILYFTANVNNKGLYTSLLSFDLKTGKTTQIVDIDTFYEITNTKSIRIENYAILSSDNYYVNLAGADYSIIQILNQKTIVHKDYDNTIDSNLINGKALFILEGKPVAVDYERVDEDDFGCEKLMVKAGEA